MGLVGNLAYYGECVLGSCNGFGSSWGWGRYHTYTGKGFQGVVKRWGFGGGPASHGTKQWHRRPGAIGAHSWPARVWKGKKMPGRTGGERVTVKNLEIVEIRKDSNLLLVKGAVPGHNGSYVIIKNPKK